MARSSLHNLDVWKSLTAMLTRRREWHQNQALFNGNVLCVLSALLDSHARLEDDHRALRDSLIEAGVLPAMADLESRFRVHQCARVANTALSVVASMDSFRALAGEANAARFSALSYSLNIRRSSRKPSSSMLHSDYKSSQNCDDQAEPPAVLSPPSMASPTSAEAPHQECIPSMNELLKSLDREECDQPSVIHNSISAAAGDFIMDEVTGDAPSGKVTAPENGLNDDHNAARPLRSWQEKRADAMRALSALARWQAEQAGTPEVAPVARGGHAENGKEHNGNAAEQAFRESVRQVNGERQPRKHRKKKGFLIIGEDDEEIQQATASATDRGRRRGGAFSRIAPPADRPDTVAPVNNNAAETETVVQAVGPEDTLHLTCRAAVTGEKILKLTLQGSALVQELREVIQKSWQADGVLQVSYEEVALEDDLRLCDVGICDHATVFVDRMPPLYVLTTSADHTARIWRTAKDRKYAELRGHVLQVQQGAFATTDVRVVTASVDGTARIWSSVTGLCEWTLQGHESQVLTAVFSRDEQLVLTASTDTTARIWKVEDGSCLLQLRGHHKAVNMARFSPDDAQVVTASADDTLRLWRSDTGECIHTYVGHQTGVFKARFSPNGSWLLSTCIDGPPRIWSTFHFKSDAMPLQGHFGGALHGDFSPDSTQVVTGGLDGHVRFWNIHTGENLQTLKGHTSQILCVVFAPNGASVVSSAADCTARIWEAATGLCMRIFTGHADAVNQAAFSRDGWMLVTGSDDGTARVWNTESGRCSRVLKGHRSAVISVEFSHM